MGNQKDVRDLLSLLPEQGFAYERTKGGHWRIRNPEGDVVSIVPGTPSDSRWRPNALRDLKKHGFDIRYATDRKYRKAIDKALETSVEAEGRENPDPVAKPGTGRGLHP